MHRDILLIGQPEGSLEIFHYRLALERGVAPLGAEPGIGSFGPAKMKRVVEMNREDQLRIIG